jgi:hypothetical protein
MAIRRAGELKHYVNVMRPTEAYGSVGELQGQDQTILQGVPCSIETLSGREAEIARSVYADVTYKVEMYADPRKPVTAEMYLTGGTLGKRKLHIGFVNDSNNMGTGSLELLCSEASEGG